MHFANGFIEAYFILGMFANFLLFIIQIMKLYKEKDSTGLSFITFFGFNLIQLSTILHGIIKHDILLTIGYILSFLACGTVTIMIPFYRRKKEKVTS